MSPKALILKYLHQ